MKRYLHVQLVRKDKDHDIPVHEIAKLIRAFDPRWSTVTIAHSLLAGTELQQFESNEKIWLEYVHQLLNVVRGICPHFFASVHLKVQCEQGDLECTTSDTPASSSHCSCSCCPS